jgi:hypothetical protein
MAKGIDALVGDSKNIYNILNDNITNMSTDLKDISATVLALLAVIGKTDTGIDIKDIVGKSN